jgi:peptidoglycan hydrolase-like protein with peptidoglycan-binding domain
MVDQMVLLAQQWVNATYRDNPGFNVVQENGQTGWDTMYALTRALQIELGITALSDNFGPATTALLVEYGNVGASSDNVNMRIIAECALYCKGYSGGSLDGSFGDSTLSGLNAMQANMGVPLANSVWPKVFKAMLTMDAYVLLGGGSASIQDAQRWLNSQYTQFTQVPIGPCDGLFSRSCQVALVYAIQYQLGMSDDQVTGYVGPGTRNGLSTAAVVSEGSTDGGASRGWVHLFQAAMKFNNYSGDWANVGTFTDALRKSVIGFQAFCMLDRTGAGDFDTWMSLLISTGNPDRAVQAFDCMYPLNDATIQTVKNAGYQYVGRYLTGGTNKQLSNSEIARIFDNGLSFFLLFQMQGDSVADFNFDQGNSDGQAAHAAAVSFGIPQGTVIYFSVDFDALETDITKFVIPHFHGVTAAIQAAGNRYAVGVYGCRNTCIRLAAEGLTSRSFVSGMSTGYSGNLGFPLPDNWAFDQIKNTTLADGTPGAIEVDNDVVSGRDLGVNSVTRPRDPNDGFYTYLTWLEARGTVYRQTYSTTYTPAELAAQYLRLLASVNNVVKFGILHISDEVFGPFDQNFIHYVHNAPGMPDLMPLRDPYLLWDTDIAHFGASFGSVTNRTYYIDPTIGFPDFASWGGDLISILGAYLECVLRAPAGSTIEDPRTWGEANIGKGSSYFSRSDAIADIDANIIGMDFLQNRNQSLVTLFQNYYASPTTAMARLTTFYDQRFGLSAAQAYNTAFAMFDQIGLNTLEAIRDGFWAENFHDTGYDTCTAVPTDTRNGIAWAWVDFLNLLTA